MGIRSLKGKIANEIWSAAKSKKLPRELWKRTRFLLVLMNASTQLENLRLKGSPPDIRLHKLTGDRRGQWSLTIHRSSGWRIVFEFKNGEFIDVEIVDYH